jgi:hypothetical protein
MCGVVNRPSAETCECGYRFDDQQEAETFLKSRLVNGWFMVVGGLLLTLVSFLVCALIIGGVLGMIVTVAPSIALFLKGTRVVDASRHGLRELRALPQARLLKGP